REGVGRAWAEVGGSVGADVGGNVGAGAAVSVGVRRGGEVGVAAVGPGRDCEVRLAASITMRNATPSNASKRRPRR
ncbi:MAG TPA: hypothetical protein VND68_05420, partial [Chloroflexia bacterium]|nr:hypothetical protein [Chloroflexia bacterium]